MSQARQSINGKVRTSGFTLVEVLVSMAIMTVGLLGVAALIGSTLASGTQARYMNIANVLASEKLDNLNKWPSNDPNVAAGGALAGPVNCAAGDAYCDQVTVSELSGANYETQTQIVVDVNGNPTAATTTIVHTNTGCVDTPANCGVPNPVANGNTFTRRWLITQSPVITDPGGNANTVTGARRITVLVSLTQAGKLPVNFQMSMVRP
jgi:type IV pilus assembly protein PilV